MAFCQLFPHHAGATDTAVSGSVVVRFEYNPAPPGNWYLDGITNTMSLTIPPIFDITVNPSAIGPTVNWADTSTWALPALDMSSLVVTHSGSGSYTAVVNEGQPTLDVLKNSGGYGPSEGIQTFVRVNITNVQPAGQNPISGTYPLNSNFVSSKFNVTIPAGAHVAPPVNAASPTLENLTIQSGGSLTAMAAFTRVRHNLTNHGSGNFRVVVEGDFINDALTAHGDVANISSTVEVHGQLQNTGDLQISGFLNLQAATANAGTIAISGGALYLAAPFTNSGTVSLSNGGISGAAAGDLTNNGSFQWSEGTISLPIVNNSSLIYSGTGSKRLDAAVTNYGTITQSSTNSPANIQTINQAGAIYDITTDSGLATNFGQGIATNAGLFRKSGGTGTSSIGVPFTNSGVIAINTGKLSFSSLTLNASSTLLFQLSGLAPGTDFGKLDRSSFTLNLAGVLEITLGSGFSPTLGNSFDLLDFFNTTGAFSSVQLPPLASGLKWNTSQLYTTGVLSVAAGIAGDFDNDGDVDGRDFLLWQRNPSVGNLSDWQGTYGVGALAGVVDPARLNAVPEPTSLITSMGCLAFLFSRTYKPAEQ